MVFFLPEFLPRLIGRHGAAVCNAQTLWRLYVDNRKYVLWYSQLGPVNGVVWGRGPHCVEIDAARGANHVGFEALKLRRLPPILS